MADAFGATCKRERLEFDGSTGNGTFERHFALMNCDVYGGEFHGGVGEEACFNLRRNSFVRERL